MNIATFRDLFHAEIKDLYDAEHRILEALETMEQAASSSELKKGFKQHHKETQKQIQRLEQVFEEFGKKPQGKKCEGTIGIIEEAEEMIENITDKAVLDAALISSAQKVEHYEMAGYGAARTYARLIGLEKSAELLQETLDEEGNTNKKLMDLAMKLNKKAEKQTA